jgi:hypothetical protein
MFSYIAVGMAGTGVYMMKESVLWRSAGWLVLGATPGGFAGAFTLQYLADLEVKLTLYGLVLISAVYSLYRTTTDGPETDSDSDCNDDAGGGDGDLQHARYEFSRCTCHAMVAWMCVCVCVCVCVYVCVCVCSTSDCCTAAD